MDVAANNNPGPSRASPFRERDIAFDPVVIGFFRGYLRMINNTHNQSIRAAMTRASAGAAFALLAMAMILPTNGWGQQSAPLLPVSVAKDGFDAEESYHYRSIFSHDKVLNRDEGFRVADENVYYNLHWDDVMPVNVVRRSGPIRELPYAPDDRIGQVRASTRLGELSLDEVMVDERSRIQGFMVVHEGVIVYEAYPGMRLNDNHIWYSTSKTVPSLLLSILEAQGKVDVNDPIDEYMTETRGTHWEGIRIIDILDMASGLDLEETQETMLSEDHKVNQFFRTSLGASIPRDDPADSSPLTVDEIIYSIDDDETIPPGTIFQYSSLNTRMLAMLVERISGRRFAELLSDYVWSMIGAEADAFIGLNPSGGAEIGGMMNSRLRDLARYGLLFTQDASSVFGEEMLERWQLSAPFSPGDVISTGCRPEIHQRALERENFFGALNPNIRCNSRQWDYVYDDGDIFKGGVGGQGLYVSPSRNLVVAFYSTTLGSWESYARAIAMQMDQ